ncbi:transketolase-like TK C-terminal-containing protein [[Mycoplasma] testudinis]|uniref:transketolase-like TK C-terminal-containing protein n=1 Tax=[Mycoplasma] testudinis TaxID=33924 RepID=UPI00056C46A9|nr:transketolase [[Mycoplasma] testudinis]
MSQVKNNLLSKKSITAIRVLSAEVVNKAKSGHTGMPLGAAPIMYALFKDHLVVDVENPKYLNRDRFVLSAGHGSALLYTTMHLAGYKDVTIEQLKRFRSIDSKTPGHPENVVLPGVDCSTGPLGQGVAIATGMAIAETKLSEYFRKEQLFNHYTYCLFGDACLQEGISFEAFSLAGRYQLNKLIYIYDSNQVQSDSNVCASTNFNTKQYFNSLGFNYFLVENGEDWELISKSITDAKKSVDKPSIIEVRTKIGFKTKYEGTNKSHALVLSDDEINQFKKDLGYNQKPFTVDNDVYKDFKQFHIRGKNSSALFQKNLKKLNGSKKSDFDLLANQKIRFDNSWFKNLKYEKAAIRNISGDIIQQFVKHNPFIFIASADLASSTKMWSKFGSVYDVNNRLGVNINMGVREFGMTAINSGITLHSGFKSINSTFLVFSDYSKAALRLAAISDSPITSVFSHDTVTVGYDGPTHQAVEQLWSLRLIPNHILFRPANLSETIFSFLYALESKLKPVTIITSRTEFLQYNFGTNDNIEKGAYKVVSNKRYDLTFLASGSEVEIAFKLNELLAKKKLIANIVSIPSWNLFTQQTSQYQKSVLGNKPIIAIEFGSSTPWLSIADLVLGVDSFGFSASPNDVIERLKLAPEKLFSKVTSFLKNKTK